MVHDTTVYVTLALTGILSFEDQVGFRIWPNPASDRVFIESRTTEVMEVEVLDLRGNRLLFNTMETPRRSCELSLDVPAGIYVVKVRTGQEVLAARFLVY